MPERLRLAELVAALSLATDLGSGQPEERSLARCLLAIRLGSVMGLEQEQLRTTYYASLLQYVGCTTDAHRIAAIWGDEIAAGDWFAEIASANPAEAVGAILRLHGASEPAVRRIRMLAAALTRMPAQGNILAAHCEVGERLAECLRLDSTVQAALTQVYERWDGKGMPNQLKGDAIALPVRILKVAQDAVIFSSMAGTDRAVDVLRSRAGAAHDPHIVDAFCRHADVLTAKFNDAEGLQAVLEAEPAVPLWLTGNQLDGALEAIADFSDLKSPYLAGHSRGVAELARDAADQFGLNAADSTNVYRAGLLHDLGRVAVSAGVWGKPGQLNDSEWERVRLHPYYTERILSRVPALAPLGTIGCKHHERLDGSGYPRGVRIADLPMSARLIAAADVYRAMLEPRPHRAAQPAAGAANVIREESKAGRLDAAAVDAVLAAAGHRVRRRRPRWPAGLSEREVDVLRLIARGRSDRDAAAILHLSSRTVHHHVQHIYDKLGVATRAAATLFAMQHGLLEPADAPER